MIDTGASEPRALASLSDTSAAGVGIGALLAEDLRPLAWLVLGGGIMVHLVGMVGLRRLLAGTGYQPAAWERLLYRLCWLIIAAIAATFLSVVLG